ncbi:hypothetical protein WN943_022947 [Citrus x changshan-huyou]
MGNYAHLHVVLTTKLSLDGKTNRQCDFDRFCPCAVTALLVLINTPLMALTAKTCFMALIMTVLFESRSGLMDFIKVRKAIKPWSLIVLCHYTIKPHDLTGLIDIILSMSMV